MIGKEQDFCKDLLGPGMDKEKFLIFDYCNNFEYFRVNPHGKDSGFVETLSRRSFYVKQGLQENYKIQTIKIVRFQRISKYISERINTSDK